MTTTPFTPENIHQGDDGRWCHDGVDVTDRPVWWTCPQGHDYQRSIAGAIAAAGRCPGCEG
ncbi:zinc-ribbon domain-containing protein [Geodermatophilus sp. SYSU D01119]